MRKKRFTRNLQIRVEPEQYEKLYAYAKAKGTTANDVIRKYIDRLKLSK